LLNTVGLTARNKTSECSFVNRLVFEGAS